MQARIDISQIEQILSAPLKLKRNHMSRRHLCERLDAACEDSVAVIVAPPGYGKSSLVAEWYYDLLEKGHARPCYIRVPQHCDENAATLSALVDFSLAQEAAEETPQTYCFIEDVHNLSDAQLLEAFDRIAALRDGGARVVVTAAAWSFALLGLCARVEIAAFGKDFLKLSYEETRRFIDIHTEGRASEDYVRAVYEFTQGWQTGVYLLTIETTFNTSTKSLARNKYINGYFSTLVGSMCDEEAAEFLFATSFLDELSPALCAHVMEMEERDGLGPEMQATAMLDRIERLGLYLSRQTNDIDSEAHYEKPFRLWLQGVFAMSHPLRAQKINRAASDWYAEKKDDAQAIKHLLMSGDAMSNFEDVRAIAKAAVFGARGEGWLQGVSSLSRDDVTGNPAFDVLAGWFFIRCGKSREAAECVIMGRKAFEAGCCLSDADAGLLRAHLECIEAKCLNMTGEDARYIQAFETLSANPTISDNMGLLCVMTYSLAESLERQGDMRRSRECYQEAVALSELCGDVFARGLSAYSLARRKVGEGRLHEAEQMCRANMEVCTDSYRGLLYVLIAYVNMLAYRIDEAEEALASAEGLLASGNVDFRFDCYIVQSMIDEHAGRIDAACSLLMHGVIIAKQNQMHQRNILMRLQTRWAYLLYRKGDYYRCRKVIEEIDQRGDVGNTNDVISVRALEIRLMLLDGEIEAARDEIIHALGVAESRGDVTCAIELRILKALAHDLAGEGEKAFLVMADALDDGARCGMNGLFVREGAAIVGILDEALSKRKLKRATRRFCETVLEQIGSGRVERHTSGGRAVSTMRELLTEREQQVLDLLSKGMARKEIAAELGIAYNTVKVHVSHIYEKLGVDNKLDAFHAAREQRRL